jgi:glycosyltransferase involved in cell wall biosynthesis
LTPVEPAPTIGPVNYGTVTVVIPTYNRRESLARTLAGLVSGGPYPVPLDVVVVDDGSTDGTREWVAAQAFPFSVRTLQQANAGPAVARTTGLSAAAGELILFLDDDVEPLPGLVGEHLAAHGERRDRVVMGPLGSLPSYPQPWVAWEQRQVEKQYRAMAAGRWQPTFRQFWTGNASVAREHLVAAGGFDPTFLRAEDVELALRMHRRGLSFQFNPRARVLHHARRSLDSWCEMHRRYGALEGRLFQGMEDVLKENWLHRHPATRALVRRCAGRPAAAAAAIAGLRVILRACERAGAERAAQVPCSVLANLLFWDSVLRTVGLQRFEELVRSAQE